MAGTAPGFLASGLAPPGTQLPFPAMEFTLQLNVPISSARGSPRLHFSQILTATTIPMAGVYIIIADIIVQIVAAIFGETVGKPGPGSVRQEGSVTMSLPQLADFMNKLKDGNWELPHVQDGGGDGTGGKIIAPGIEVQTPQPLTLVLAITGTASTDAGAPIFSLLVPLISFQGITGGLPVIIIGLIAVILIRQVVPPIYTGVEPITEQDKEPTLQIKAKELMQLLRSYGRNFK